jgi:hypothetical protein
MYSHAINLLADGLLTMMRRRRTGLLVLAINEGYGGIIRLANARARQW